MEIAKFMLGSKIKCSLFFFLTITFLILVKSTNTIPDKKLKVDIIIIHFVANFGGNDLIMSA